jgi:hypothetical protein
MLALNCFLKNSIELGSLLTAKSDVRYLLIRTVNCKEHGLTLETDNQQSLNFPAFWNLDLLYNFQKELSSKSHFSS